jgi:hypothetical protein
MTETYDEQQARLRANERGRAPPYDPTPPAGQGFPRAAGTRRLSDEGGEFEFTDAHRLAANRAHANGKVIVIDRGPAEPVAAKVEGEQTEDEIKAEKHRMILTKRDHDAWHKAHDEPIALEMSRIDADHAVAADPDRYVHVPRGIRAPITVEERLTRLEQRLGPETDEEIDKRRERDGKIAEDRRNAQKAGE